MSADTNSLLARQGLFLFRRAGKELSRRGILGCVRFGAAVARSCVQGWAAHPKLNAQYGGSSGITGVKFLPRTFPP